MGLFMNNDPSDNSDELKIKTILAYLFVMAFLSIIVLVLVTGCAKQVELFDCVCDCNNSKFECSSTQHILETDLQ